MFAPRRIPIKDLITLRSMMFSLCFVCGLFVGKDIKAESTTHNHNPLSEVAALEDVYFALSPALKEIEADLLNLEVPDPLNAASPFLVLPTPDAAPSDALNDRLRRFRFLVSAHVSIMEGRFLDRGHQRLETTLNVSWRGVTKRSSSAWVRGQMRARWTRAHEQHPGEWKIVEWEALEFTKMTTTGRLYEEVLDAVIPDARTRRRLRRSRHEELVVRLLRDPTFKAPHPYFAPESWDRHPALSIVDINGDGLDDIYVMARFGPNMLLVNQGDGTFADRAARWGLDISDHASSALFADFDNDGDPDLLLGRTLESTLYLEQVDGSFIDRSRTHIVGRLPKLVSAIAAADYDRDGLLDAFIATYAGETLRSAFMGLGTLLPPKARSRLERALMAPSTRPFVNIPGPPNVLLHNIGGGRLEVVTAASAPTSLKNTYQGAWADYDLDGYPDLYVANDYAYDELWHNEGDGRFKEVGKALGLHARLGLGMGVSWADVDEDGDFDLYVSNMESHAGRRITAEIPGLDARVRQASSGNALILNNVNEGGGFSYKKARPGQRVVEESAGWSWGGQFIDVNRDGRMDLHVPNGFYTAPPAVAEVGDT